MHTYRLIDTNTNATIAEVEAKTALEVVKKYDLASRSNSHIKLVQLEGTKQ